jgi:hypothetical protein
MFLRNVGIDLQIHTAPKSKPSTITTLLLKLSRPMGSVHPVISRNAGILPEQVYRYKGQFKAAFS